MKRVHSEEHNGCIKTEGEAFCYDHLEEMMDDHKAQRGWLIARWEDWLYYPLYRFFVWTIWERIRPGKFKHWYQRARYGYSYMDNWDTGSWLLDTIIPQLHWLRANKHGVPCSMFKTRDLDKEGIATKGGIIRGNKRFNLILDEMIEGLEAAQTLSTLSILDKDNIKLLEKKSKRAFSLLGKHLFTLWD
jgi:hypothetical protein